MKTKKIVLAMFIVLLNAIIFLFSGQDGKASEALSDVRVFVRKSAHFGIYFVLGILVYLFVCCYDVKRPIVLAILACAMFAGLDEFHQLFSPGRTARLYDIGIDTLGSSFGVGCILTMKKILKKRK